MGDLAAYPEEAGGTEEPAGKEHKSLRHNDRVVGREARSLTHVVRLAMCD
jgi:hypothetical protein